MAYVVATEGLGSLDDLDELDERIIERARMAVNKTADWSRTRSSELIRGDIAFSASYLTGADKSGKPRLGVTQRATNANLEAAITGRFEPTSLATFVSGSKTPNRRAPTLRVSPGRTTSIGKSFIMRLRRGQSELGNLGLAIRLKPGERVRNKREQVFKAIGKGLYLLYGPSVDQVFTAVADDVAPDSADYLEREFLRLMRLELS